MSTSKVVKDKDRIQTYQKLLKASASYTEKEFTKRADRMVKLYEVEHYVDENGKPTKADYDRIKVAYPYRTVRQIMAETYVKVPTPVVKVEKKSVDGVDPTEGAENMKGALSYVIRKSNLKREAKRAVTDGTATGVGVMFMYTQKDSKIPKFERKLYREVLWSADVSDVYKSPWVACKIVRPLEDIKEDETYSKEEREKVPAAKLDETLYGKSDITYGILWDFYDKQKDIHCVFPDGGDCFLLDQKITDTMPFKAEEDGFLTEWPAFFYINEEEISSAFGMGDIYPIESQSKELDKTRTQQMNHRKRFNRKYLAKKGFFDDQGMRQLKSDEDGTVVETTQEILPSMFSPVIDAPLGADVYKNAQDALDDMQRIAPLGPDSLSSGVGSQPETLGQAQIIEQNSQPRMNEKRDNVAEFFKRVFRLTAQYIQHYWVEEDVLRITGDGRKETDWLNWSPEQARGEYDYDVEPESSRDNTAVDRAQISQALQVATPLLAQLNPNGIQVMLRKYLETFPALGDIDLILPEPPGEEAMQGNPESDQEILDLINSTDPDEFLDTINKLPQNEKQTILASVERLTSQGQVPGMQQNTPVTPQDGPASN